MKSYKNKRVRSSRNKSRRYSRKRKGGEIVIDATTPYLFHLLGYRGCKDLKNKVLKIKQDYPNETFTFSDKAQEQITKCNRDMTYRDEIENMIAPQQSIVTQTTQENVQQYPVIPQEEIKKAKEQIAQEEKIAALAEIAQARAKTGVKPYTSGEIPTMGDEGPQSNIPISEKRSSVLEAGPYNGGKKRRHRKKSRKHSRRH